MRQSTVRATIRRATTQAHRQVDQLDAEAARDLTHIYRAAAKDIAQRIRDYAGHDASITLAELRNILAQVEGRLRELGHDRDRLLDTTLSRAVDLGVTPLRATLTPAAAIDIGNEALSFVRNFVAEDGLQLSDRVWRLDRGAKDEVTRAIEQAVIQGHGASQATTEFLARGKPVPIDVRSKLQAANADTISRSASQLMTGRGSPMDNALRLFRTEINRAHGEAFMMRAEDTPGFIGFRFLLSPAHPEPDICDLLAAQNLYGLGPGVYPSRQKLPWPAHPNTLSYVEIVFDDEITDDDRKGKETPLQALERLSPEQRAGALGVGKSKLFDRGELKQGMIRAPLRAVRQRLGTTPPPRAKPQALATTPVVSRTAPATLAEFIGWGNGKADELLAEVRRRGGGFDVAFPKLLQDDLAAVRAMAHQAKVGGSGRAASLVRSASELFPDDWTRAADRFGPLEARYSNSRAYYIGTGSGAGEIQARNLSSAVHEYAHRLQHALPGIDDFFQDLHHQRTAGNALKRLRDLYPGVNYSPSEVAREDRYITPYQGRVYSDPRHTYLGKHGALEVMSMAYEYLLGGQPGTAEALSRWDRELFNLAIGLLYRYVP
ncbi:MAG: hypothetical protein KIT73_06820 [Burkholderiales bacterium]|nr:hypothetical protein [Burkholderiales bacterium]